MKSYLQAIRRLEAVAYEENFPWFLRELCISTKASGAWRIKAISLLFINFNGLDYKSNASRWKAATWSSSV